MNSESIILVALVTRDRQSVVDRLVFDLRPGENLPDTIRYHNRTFVSDPTGNALAPDGVRYFEAIETQA